MKNQIFILITFLFIVGCLKSNKNSQSNQSEVFSKAITVDGKLNDWSKTNYLKGLTDPWGVKGKDSTQFDYKIADENFYFYFKTIDSTLTLPKFVTERSVIYADRVEMFFSKDKDLTNYYCFEITPKEEILDYSAQPYRKFDRDWDFKTLKIKAVIINDRYIVEGKIALLELKELGLIDDIYLGVFRADFKDDENVNWYTKTIPNSPTPDFHIPSAFDKIRLNE